MIRAAEKQAGDPRSLRGAGGGRPPGVDYRPAIRPVLASARATKLLLES